MKYKEIVVELNEKLREGWYESLLFIYVVFLIVLVCFGDYFYFGLFLEISF